MDMKESKKALSTHEFAKLLLSIDQHRCALKLELRIRAPACHMSSDRMSVSRAVSGRGCWTTMLISDRLSSYRPSCVSTACLPGAKPSACKSHGLVKACSDRAYGSGSPVRSRVGSNRRDAELRLHTASLMLMQHGGVSAVGRRGRALASGCPTMSSTPVTYDSTSLPSVVESRLRGGS